MDMRCKSIFILVFAVFLLGAVSASFNFYQILYHLILEFLRPVMGVVYPHVYAGGAECYKQHNHRQSGIPLLLPEELSQLKICQKQNLSCFFQ